MNDKPKLQSLQSVVEQLAAADSARENTMSKSDRRARTVARLAAVQALYQMELSGVGFEAVVREFSDHRFDSDIEGEPLGAADELKPAAEGTVEAWGRSPKNPVGGWYGLRKGYRGRFGMYVPPLLEQLGLVELEHNPKNNRVRAR